MHAPSARAAAALTLLALAAAAAGCLQEEAPEPVRTDTVEIESAWAFKPQVIEVAPGTTVTWVNNGNADHTVTFDDLPLDAVIDPGGRVRYTFNETGTYDYVCEYHIPDMVGTVIVTSDDA